MSYTSKNKTLSKWRAGRPVFTTTLHFNDPAIFEMAGLLGFELLWIDLEHHARSVETAANLIRAARAGGSEVMARPAKGEVTRLARLLEAGAGGILYPRCTSAAEAAEVVRNAKFPPWGARGVDGAGPDAGYGLAKLTDYLEHANRETFVAIQIEDDEGLANAPEIARVEGVDLLFFGPGDFSIQGGFPGRFEDPRYEAALRKVAAAAREAGKHWGTPAFSTVHARQLLSEGAMLVTRTSDIGLLRTALQQLREDFTFLESTDQPPL